MRKVFDIAVRELIATVTTKAFILGLLVMPAIIALLATAGPRLFNFRNFQIKGDVAVVDPTGQVAGEMRSLLDPEVIRARRKREADEALARAPEFAKQAVDAASDILVPELRLIERPADADISQEKVWLNTGTRDDRHLALVVIHADAVTPAESGRFGTYDIYVPQDLDDRAESEIHQSVRDAIVNARIQARSLDRDAIRTLIRVARPASVTVTKVVEKKNVGAFNVLLPIAFSVLLFVGVMTGSQALLTSTVEEKSSRVIEVLLSAVSPMQLMAGKLLGQLGVSAIALFLYIAMGLFLLTSFSLMGLLNPWLILYLAIFFLITYLIFGSLLMAIGSAVNDMREAQSLMMPIMLVLVIPYMLALPISRDPNSVFSTVISFVPPINGFAMLLRMASVTPPPIWQVWLSIAIGVGAVFAALWFTAKVFRIGLLMYGKPPNFATLIRWMRAA
jgi:ABC-2 type transport system permease protein